MRKRATILCCCTLVLIGGCDQARRREPDIARDETPSGSTALTDNVMAGVREDTDRARIALLENQVDELSAVVARSESATIEARVSALEARLPPITSPEFPSPSKVPENMKALPKPSSTLVPAPAPAPGTPNRWVNPSDLR